MFWFNVDKFDFWPIYDAIKFFYPIGIKKENEIKMFYSYPGLKRLYDIVIENIHNSDNYNSRWNTFTQEIQQSTGKETISTTYGQAPSFSSRVVLETHPSDGLIRQKQVSFFVSLAGPFYTVIGEEIISGKAGEGTFLHTACLVVSPENEFAEVFKLLCNKIEDRFQGYRFVPFEICRQTIDGLDVRYTDNTLNSIFHALFNDHIDLDVKNIVGDKYYKSADWIKEGWVDDGATWVMYPPTGV